MRRIPRGLCYGLAVLVSLLAAHTVSASLCFLPPPTLSEQVAAADGVYLARVVSRAEFNHQDIDGEQYTIHSTTYEIVHAMKGGLPGVISRAQIIIDQEHDGKPGDLVLLFGTLMREDDDDEEMELIEDDAEEAEAIAELDAPADAALATVTTTTYLSWEATQSISWAGYDYVKGLPPAVDELGTELRADRLQYFLAYLEHADAIIAEDAFTELDRASFADLISLADHLPRAKLREWLATSEELWFRRRLYGVMLGLCGGKEDAAVLREISLAAPHPDELGERFGVDGVMVGYLLLTGEAGLSDLAQRKLHDQAADVNESYAVLEAIGFLYRESPQSIPVARLRSAVRDLLIRQEMASIAISKLAELADWEVRTEVISLFDACGYEADEIRQAIVHYLQAVASQLDNPSIRAASAQAQATLLELRSREPQLMEQAITLDLF